MRLASSVKRWVVKAGYGGLPSQLGRGQARAKRGALGPPAERGRCVACGAAANSRIHICKDTGGSHSLRKSCGGGRAMSLIRRRPPGRAGPARPRGLAGTAGQGGPRRPRPHPQCYRRPGRAARDEAGRAGPPDPLGATPREKGVRRDTERRRPAPRAPWGCLHRVGEHCTARPASPAPPSHIATPLCA